MVDALGDRLGAILGDEDERSRMVAFRDWAADLYDALGDACWAEISSAT